MYPSGGETRIHEHEKMLGKVWQGDGNERASRNGKRFVPCICPKCTVDHNVYMRWTGRGVPRKYCGNCKPLVSGYDEAAIYEATISAPGYSKKKGRRHEGE